MEIIRKAVPERKKLIESYDPTFTTQALKESDGQEKRWYLYGVAAQANTKNGNGRIYEGKALKEAVNKYQHVIKNKLPQCMGEVGHPSGQDPNRSDSEISFDWVSHMIVELKADEKNKDNYVSKSKILKNPIGMNYIVPILEEGITLAFSTRGFGDAVFSESEGADIVTEYELLTIDIVARPSAPDAHQKGMYENAKKFAKILTEARTHPTTGSAKQVAEYYETLEFFKKIGKETVFIETLESYSWNYMDFYKDLNILTHALIRGE